VVHQAEFVDAQLQDCRHLGRFIFVGVVHTNADDPTKPAAKHPPKPGDHLIGLLWYAGADDLQRLVAVELNPFEGFSVLALLAGDVNVDEVAPLVRRVGLMMLGGRFLRHGLPLATVGFGERRWRFVCSGNGSGNGGLWERGRGGREWDFVQCVDEDFAVGGSFGVVCVVGVVAWGHRLQSLVSTAQWVARMVAWKN